jgi:GNAT superfamily N-acetyltransferase
MTTLRKFRKSDAVPVALLVMRTYKKHNFREAFKKSAAQEYVNHYDPKKNTQARLVETFSRTPIFYVTLEKKAIVGMIRGRPGRISNLFVDAKQHHKGIGRILVKKFEAEARKRGSREIKIHASMYAIPFYQSMGYKKTTGVRNFRGLRVVRMKKLLR